MRVFVTGASGWIGSATVDELLAAGHEVTGLVRSDTAAETLQAKGAEARRGDLDDLAGIRAGAEEADAVVHLANKHDFVHPELSNAAERAAVEAIGEVLAGSGRPFALASGLAGPPLGRPRREDDPSPFTGPESARGGSENRALDFVERDVRVVPVRFAPTVHGAGDHGFIAALVDAARQGGRSVHVGDGANRWAAVHVSDAAKAVRLGLEQAPAGTVVHAVAEEGVSTRDIAEAIGRGLGLPVESTTADAVQEQLGFIGMVFASDVSASSARTRELLGWTPSGPTLLEDLATPSYFA